MSSAVTAASGRERILATAERLIAEQGAAVSLREVAAAAGQKNTSAVHYHFGNRDRLIEAIVTERQELLEKQRLVLLAGLDGARQRDLRALVGVLVSPLVTVPQTVGATHHVRFLEKVRDHAALSPGAWMTRDWPGSKLVIGAISDVLADLPPAEMLLRLQAMSTAMFALVADIERCRDAGTPHLSAEQVTELLVGMVTAGSPPHPALPDQPQED